MFVNLYFQLTQMLLALVAGGRRRVAAGGRAANFIEYALLAVIAVVVFVAIKQRLFDALTGIFNHVSTALGWGDQTS